MRCLILFLLALTVIVAQVEVTQLDITQGPENGGTIISVTGSGFVSSGLLQCRFDDVEVTAIFNSNTVIVCQTPLHAIGVVTVSASNDGTTFSTSTVSFTYNGMRYTLVSDLLL